MGYGREEGKLLRPGALFKDGKWGPAAPDSWFPPGGVRPPKPHAARLQDRFSSNPRGINGSDFLRPIPVPPLPMHNRERTKNDSQNLSRFGEPEIPLYPQERFETGG